MPCEAPAGPQTAQRPASLRHMLAADAKRVRRCWSPMRRPAARASSRNTPPTWLWCTRTGAEKPCACSTCTTTVFGLLSVRELSWLSSGVGCEAHDIPDVIVGRLFRRYVCAMRATACVTGCSRLTSACNARRPSLLADQMLQHRKTAPVRTPPAVEPWRPRSVRQSQPPHTCAMFPPSISAPLRVGPRPARSALASDAIPGLLPPRRPVAEGTTSTPICGGSSRASIRTRACTRAMAAQFLAILMRCVCVCVCV